MSGLGAEPKADRFGSALVAHKSFADSRCLRCVGKKPDRYWSAPQGVKRSAVSTAKTDYVRRSEIVRNPSAKTCPAGPRDGRDEPIAASVNCKRSDGALCGSCRLGRTSAASPCGGPAPRLFKRTLPALDPGHMSLYLLLNRLHVEACAFLHRRKFY
jgi:hypothetical protein